MEGRWTKNWIQWNALQAFWDKVLGWLRPNDERDPIPAHEARVGLSTNRPFLDLFVYDDIGADSQFRFSVNDKGSKAEGVLQKVAPGHYQVALPLVAPGDYRIELTEERRGRRVAYPSVGYNLPYELNSELPRPEFNLPLLSLLAQASGGEINPKSVEYLQKQDFTDNYRPLRQPLIIWAAALFLFEIVGRKLFLSENLSCPSSQSEPCQVLEIESLADNFSFDTASKTVYQWGLLAMGLETEHTGTRGTFSGRRHSSAFPSVFRTLIWLWVIGSIFALKPTVTQAAKQKTLRKETPKGKTAAPAPPIKRLTKPQSEVPADALERREHVIQQTKVGDTLQELLSRFGLPNGERQLWTRSIQRDIGPRGLLPGGKEVHFYFTKPTPGTRQIPQLKAMEVDFSDPFNPHLGKEELEGFLSRSAKSLTTSS